MTRQVSMDSVSALLTRQNRTVSNTSVIDGKLYLFGNNIIKLDNDDLYIRIHTNSVTTRERLNTLNKFGYNCHVKQVKGNVFVNGKAVNDYMEWIKIDKV